MTEGVARAEWESPRLKFEGNLHEIVLNGMGKGSGAPKDPGEPAKVSN